MNQPRERFSTRFGAIATTVGSAVGLGNIWRFPFEAGNHGGGAFLLLYIAFIVLLGIPVLMAEFVIGRGTRSNIFGALRKLGGSRWHWTGFIGIVASLMILSFYSVVAGWTLHYFFESFDGALVLENTAAFHSHFTDFSSSWAQSLGYTLLFLALNAAILLRGVAKGIEKVSNVLMPVLFALLLLFCINSLTMDGCAEGLRFLFLPDFGKITAPTVLGALGQAFFSLSLGLGCMLTYASYFTPETRLGRSAFTTAALDTLVAILAGVIIFPAVFTYGFEPATGPQLVFEVLPAIFVKMAGGMAWSALFFFLLFLASLTSTISMSEISIAFFTEELGMKRRGAVWLSTAIAVTFGSLCALSFGVMADVTIFGLTVFNLFDYVASNILLPLGGMIIAIFAGWFVDKRLFRAQLTNDGRHSFCGIGLLRAALRYVAPVAIMLVFLNAIGVL